MPFSSKDDVTQRLQEQTNLYLKQNYENKVQEIQRKLDGLRAIRTREAEETAELFHALIDKMDRLLEFIAQRCDGIPPEIIELIAERQEQRIEACLPASGIDLADTDAVTGLLPSSGGLPINGGVIGQSGQVLRRSNGTVGWTTPDDFAPKTLQTIRAEVERLVGKMKSE